MKAKSRVLSLVLAAVMLAAMCFAIPVQLTAQASNGITSVVFDYTDGESAVWTGLSAGSQTKTQTVAVSSDTVTAVSNSGILNLKGWSNNGKIYAVGSEIPVAQLIADSNGTTATLTPVFGAYTEDFSNLSSSDAKWWSAKTLGTGEAVVGNDGDAQGSYVKFTTNSDFRGVALTDENGKYINFNKGITYKVSLKYKSTGATNIQIYFGAPVKNTTGASGSGYIQKNTVKAVSGAVSEWTEAAVYVTAPDTYNVTTAHVSINDYSRVMGIGYTKNASGATLCIDDVTITPVEILFESTVSDIDDIYMSFDEDGNITLPEAKAHYSYDQVEKGILNLFWKNGNKYYKPGETVNRADLVCEGLTCKFTTHFGTAEVTYDKLTDTADGSSTNAFYTAARFYGTGNFVTSENDEIGETDTNGTKIKSHECIDLVKGASVNEFRNALFVQTGGTAGQNVFNPAVDKSVHFEPGKEYEITFRYRSYIAADFYAAFGIPADTNCGSGGQHVLLAQTQASNSSTATGIWETKTVTVTAPTADKVTTTRMGISVKVATSPSGHNQLRIDDITVVPVEDKVTVKYDFGDSENVGDMKTQTVYKTGEIALEFPTKSDIINLTGWKYGKKVFAANETVTAAHLADSEGNIPSEVTLTAVYGETTVDFSGLSEGFKFWDGKTFLGTGAAAIATDDTYGEYVKFTVNNTSYRGFALTNDASSFVNYSLNATYKVSFEYKTTGKANVNLTFGVPVGENGPCGSTVNERTSVVSATAAVENWTQVTAYVTAPADYYADDYSANVELTSKYYTRVMGMGISNSTNGTVVSIDNVTITPVSSAQVSAYALFVNKGNAPLADAQGNEMAPGSVVYKKNGSERTAFRFIAAFDYYADENGDLYLDKDKTVKILKRGMLVGIYDGTNYTQKANSEVAANAAAWTNNGKTLEYSFKIYNISEKNKDTVYYARPYLIVEGKEEPIYGTPQKTSVQQIFDEFSAKNNTIEYGWYGSGEE